MSRRPNENEDEYIARQEMEKRRSAVADRRKALAEEEAERLKQTHWMRCAKCGEELQEIEFRGVKIDKCFSCGGVYLDDGELEQLAGKPDWFSAMVTFFK
jgi:hypothetical protein